jgi:hypothetical protein
MYSVTSLFKENKDKNYALLTTIEHKKRSNIFVSL